MSEALKELGEHISAALPDAVISADVAFDELTVNIHLDHIVSVLVFLRDESNCQFKVLSDITGMDHPERTKRFDVIYQLLSMHQNQRIRVKGQVDEDTPVPSVVSVFPAAEWAEREAFDMYGILFADHPDLRRLLTDYGFQGFPLRKDFPVTGFVECRYDEEQKRVVYEPVKLTQEFRNFDFMSPWEGAEYILPGDEKAEGEASGS